MKDFDVVTLSYEVGALKPDSQIFKALIGKSGCKPEEVVFSDDNQETVEAAQKLGINAFLYQNFEQFKEKLAEFGVGCL